MARSFCRGIHRKNVRWPKGMRRHLLSCGVAQMSQCLRSLVFHLTSQFGSQDRDRAESSSGACALRRRPTCKAGAAKAGASDGAGQQDIRSAGDPAGCSTLVPPRVRRSCCRSSMRWQVRMNKVSEPVLAICRYVPHSPMHCGAQASVVRRALNFDASRSEDMPTSYGLARGRALGVRGVEGSNLGRHCQVGPIPQEVTAATPVAAFVWLRWREREHDRRHASAS
jgi:hypothetical protein